MARPVLAHRRPDHDSGRSGNKAGRCRAGSDGGLFGHGIDEKAGESWPRVNGIEDGGIRIGALANAAWSSTAMRASANLHGSTRCPVTTLFNIPLTASTPSSPKPPRGSADSSPSPQRPRRRPAHRVTTARRARHRLQPRAPHRARQARTCARTHSRARSCTDMPLRPPRGHIVDAPAYMRAARAPDAGRENTLLQASHDETWSCTSHASLGRHGS